MNPLTRLLDHLLNRLLGPLGRAADLQAAEHQAVAEPNFWNADEMREQLEGSRESHASRASARIIVFPSALRTQPQNPRGKTPGRHFAGR